MKEFVYGRADELKPNQAHRLEFLENQLEKYYDFENVTRYNGLQQSLFDLQSAQSCADMNIFVQWKGLYEKMFVKSYQGRNDFGVCCSLVPYLEFENPETSDGKYYDVNVSWKGELLGQALHGISKGLRMFIDLESYEYADYYMTGSLGFRMALGYAAIEKPIIGQYGFYIAKGIN